MRKNHLKNKESSSLHDIVFLMAAGFFVLFMVAFFYVNPVAKLGKITKAAEFIITVTWPNNMNVDIDTWIRDPNGVLIWYQAKTPNNSLVHLERDDLGISNDTVIMDGKVVRIERNEEMVTIRGIHPGRYVINLHYYNANNIQDAVPVTVKLEKLNPTVSQVFYTVEPIILRRVGQEVTVIHFEVGIDGRVTNVTTGPAISLIKQRGENMRYYNGNGYEEYP